MRVFNVKFLLVTALAENHGYSQLVNSLHEALLEIGQEPTISDQSVHAVDGAVDVNQLARELQASKYDVVFSFSSFFGGAVIADGNSLFDHLGVKFLGWQVDHPIYAPNVLFTPMQNRHTVYSNHNHLRFGEAVRIEGAATTMLLGAQTPKAPPKDYKSREWPVFVAASWNGVPERTWEAMEDSPAKRLLGGIVDWLMDDPEASLLDAFNGTADSLGLGARLGVDREFDESIIEFLRAPLGYLRLTDRINIIRNLALSGVPLTICGGVARIPGRQTECHLYRTVGKLPRSS